MHRRTSPRRLAAAAAAMLLVPVAGVAQTTDQLKREVAAVGVEEKLGAAVPAGLVLTEAEGRALALGPTGKPVLLSFNYTRCPKLCGLQLAGMARALRDAGWDGGGFEVLTVSVDPEEQLPQLLRLKQAKVREAGGTPAIDRAWRFAKGAKADVAALADAVGFKYRYDPATGEFAHQATLVVLTGDGRVSGYLHGISYRPEALHAALDRALGGQVATAAEQRSIGGFLLTCIGLDPTGKAPLALRLMRAAGVAVFLFLALFLGRNVLRDQRRRPRTSPR